jgi:hypothetical protein
LENLIHPQTAAERTNALVLREKYKIDPLFLQKVDAQWGPLDWRLPEAHAIYWYAAGLEAAKKNPGKVNQEDLMHLRRGIYQSEQQTFYHGRLSANPFDNTYALAPNLDLAANASDAYLQMYAEEADQGQRDGILRAHRNFLKDAVYFLYENNRVAEAAKWYKMLGDRYPNMTILDNDPNSFPRNLTLDEYAVARVQSEIGDTSQERTTAVVQGLLARSYYELAIGQDDRAAGFKLLARKVYEHYVSKTSDRNNTQERIALPPLDVLNRTVVNQLLDPQQGAPYAMRAVLRTQLGLPAETNAPPVISTNQIAPPVLPETNVPASTNK